MSLCLNLFPISSSKIISNYLFIYFYVRCVLCNFSLRGMLHTNGHQHKKQRQYWQANWLYFLLFPDRTSGNKFIQPLVWIRHFLHALSSVRDTRAVHIISNTSHHSIYAFTKAYRDHDVLLACFITILGRCRRRVRSLMWRNHVYHPKRGADYIILVVLLRPNFPMKKINVVKSDVN